MLQSVLSDKREFELISGNLTQINAILFGNES